MAADAKMIVRMRDSTENEACTHLHKHGHRQHKSCEFLSVGTLSFGRRSVRFVVGCR